MGTLQNGLASGRGGCRPDLHKKSPVRKAVLTRFLTIRELGNGHFAYALGRADDRPDGVLKVGIEAETKC